LLRNKSKALVVSPDEYRGYFDIISAIFKSGQKHNFVLPARQQLIVNCGQAGFFGSFSSKPAPDLLRGRKNRKR
jgi:hypothetical protein